MRRHGRVVGPPRGQPSRPPTWLDRLGVGIVLDPAGPAVPVPRQARLTIRALIAALLIARDVSGPDVPFAEVDVLLKGALPVARVGGRRKPPRKVEVDGLALRQRHKQQESSER